MYNESADYLFHLNSSGKLVLVIYIDFVKKYFKYMMRLVNFFSFKKY